MLRPIPPLWVILIAIPLAFCLGAFRPVWSESPRDNVRPSILAGAWYPGNPEALQAEVRSLLAGATTSRLEERIVAIVVPHAGYRYSGSVAAHAYRLLEGTRYTRVVMVGPSHRPFPGVSVNLQHAYETPLGLVPVDLKTAERIQAAGANIRWVKQAHAVEHSLEIQLPFLQTVLTNFQIVPILMGEQDYDTCIDLVDALTQTLGGQTDTLLLASTDLSHFHTYETAKAMDGRFVRWVQQLDARGLSDDLRAGACEACGGGPVVTIVTAARQLGANRSLILRYANSGDVTGDHSRVVGYLAAALLHAP